MPQDLILEESAGLFRITALKTFRRTAGVIFDALPASLLPSVSAIDRVIHESGALSPGSVGGVERPWYKHAGQEDNLVVLAGFRDVELFRQGRSVRFRIGPARIEKDGTLLFDRPVMLSWPVEVFHRIISSPERGSASVNLAVRRAGFDFRTEFNIYDLDPATGEAKAIREGRLDQFGE